MLDWLFSKPLAEGTPAPDFDLEDEQGNRVTLSGLRGQNVVLIFYPGDDTPGCTKQLCSFRDQWTEAQARNTRVFGVNPQGSKSHTKFIKKFNLPFPLLIDRGQKMGEAYKTRGLIVKRTVYLIDPEGVVRFGRRGMPKPAEVLAAAR